MKSVLQQLGRWRLRERVVRLTWGTSRLLAVAASVLALACLGDWLYDRYADTPFWLRVLATVGQVALAAGLAVVFLVRPWVRTPPVDDLALRAERTIPEFGHRLVTAIQLNRPDARTAGMSKALIAEVTREAEQLAFRHDLTKLIDYRPVRLAVAVFVPVLVVWGAFLALKTDLGLVLLKRQLLLDADIPRSVKLDNVTQDVWPSGAEVTIKYRVSGAYRENATGTVLVRPDDQPEDAYTLAFDKDLTAAQTDGSAIFTAKLPPSSVGFHFRARLHDGRTRSLGRVDFEPPPQATDIEAWQLLPGYLGKQSNGSPFERYHARGEVVNALPGSDLRIEASFNKAVVKAFLTPIERGDGNKDVDGVRRDADLLAPDGKAAGWSLRTTPRLIGYKIELIDGRGFVSSAPARRGVRMLPDEPPFVEFKKETTRNPDATAYDGKGSPRVYEWDNMPLPPNGRAMVIYGARSECGIGRVNLAYRVIPKNEPPENLHPRDDPGGQVFTRLPMSRVIAELDKNGKPLVGAFLPDLGLFEKSGKNGQVEFYPLPAPPGLRDAEPGDLSAGGRFNFEVSGLRKKRMDGTPAELEVGDTVEIYVEVFDKVTDREGKPIPNRPAGYTKEARRKTIVTEDEARLLTRQRDEAQRRLQDKLAEIEAQQRELFNPKK